MTGRSLAYACVAMGALMLGGCASAATTQGMTVTPGQVAATPAPEMAKTVTVNEVVGGRATHLLETPQIENADFKAALVGSLRKAGFFAEGAPARYSMKATLVRLAQPTAGFEMTVTSSIRYKLIDTTTGAVVFEEEIVAPYTAHLGDGFLGSTRLRIATEGAARANIASLIDKLNAKKVAKPAAVALTTR